MQSGQLQPEMYGSTPPVKQGAARSPFTATGSRRSVILHVVLCFGVPWIIFSLLFALNSIAINYKSPGLVKAVSYVILAGIAAAGINCIRSWLYIQSVWRGAMQEPAWLSFFVVTSLLAWILGGSLGQTNFNTNTVPFMQINALNDYVNVNPSIYAGSQVMDAGQIVFLPDSKVDIGKSMGFRNSDTYCVAPIVSPALEANQTTFDFWAIGKNCCLGHAGDFRCGEIANPGAHAGMRLMQDSDRQFYLLAVNQAEAAFGITASHPMFFFWMEDPQREIGAYETAAMKGVVTALVASAAVQLFLVLVATILMSRLPN